MNDPLKDAGEAETMYSIPKEVMDKAIELVELVDRQSEYGVTIVFNRGLSPEDPAPLLSGGLDLTQQAPFLSKVFDALAAALSQGPSAEGQPNAAPVCNCPRCQERRRLEQAQKTLH